MKLGPEWANELAVSQAAFGRVVKDVAKDVVKEMGPFDSLPSSRSAPGVRTRSQAKRAKAEAPAAEDAEAGEAQTFSVKFSPAALQCLQVAAEEFLRGVMEDARVFAVHAKRVTVMTADIKLAGRPVYQGARLHDMIEAEPEPPKRRRAKEEQVPKKKRQMQVAIRQERPRTLD